MSLTPKKLSLIIPALGQKEKIDKFKNSEMWQYLLHFRLPCCGHVRMSLRMYLEVEEADRQRERQPLVSQIWHFPGSERPRPLTPPLQATQVSSVNAHTHIVICFCFPSAQGLWHLSNILLMCYCIAAIPRSRVRGSFSFEMISHAIPRPWSSSKSSLINLAL